MALATALLSTSALPARAGHVYAGIIDTNGIPGLQAGDALSFVSNTTGEVVTGPSQGVQSMSLVLFGGQAGFYQTSNISYTGLSNGLNWTGSGYRPASPYAATSGSRLQLRIASVTGPAGAQFSLWDDAVSTTGPAITFTIGTGITTGTGIFDLTDLSLLVGDGVTTSPAPTATNNPPVDPYGHIHGRSMTVDTPGEYTVSFILHDANPNNPHPDGAPFVVSYSAVPEPTAVALLGGAAMLLGLLRRRARA